MRDAFGGAFMIKIFIIFIFVYICLTAMALNYAKAFKVKIREFAIGFGPTIWKKTGKTGTAYALRLIPLGGFVSMQGEEERSDEEGSFSKASIPKDALTQEISTSPNAS